MLIPYSTDAPIYHYPAATGGLIAANVLAFVLAVSAPEAAEPWILHYGQWNPLQWLTSTFLHGGVMHLFMNMAFLWIFGLVVEGKIGWRRMLVLYLGIAVGQSGVEQAMMLGAEEGGSLGASSAIYGLMAIAMIWAPVNEISGVALIGFRVITFEVKIWVLACLYLAIDLMSALVWREMGSEVLHLMGAGLGAAVGAAMVTRGWVDCENWDVFSLRQGRHQMTREQLAEFEAQSPEKQAKRRQRREEALQQIQTLIAEGNPVLAYSAHQHCQHKMEGWSLADQDLLRIIAGFHQKKLWRESIPAMVEYLRRDNPPQAAAVRLHLARILLEHEQRPGQTLRVLAKIDETALTESQRAAYHKLKQKAARLHEEDPYEATIEDW